MPDVPDLWTPEDLDIREYSDTDLEASRTFSSRLYDSSGHLHGVLDTYVTHSDVEDRSAAADRALRVELAAWLDSTGPVHQRGDFDVAYTIPPDGWVAANCPQAAPETVVEANADAPHVNFTTAEVVNEIATAAIDTGAFESTTTVVEAGLKQMLDL
jgi:hypothetical protein